MPAIWQAANAAGWVRIYSKAADCSACARSKRSGMARYGDWMERLVYNGIGAALPMGPNGQTFYYSDYRLGGGRKIYHRAQNDFAALAPDAMAQTNAAVLDAYLGS